MLLADGSGRGGIPAHQIRSAMPQQGGNGTEGLAIHRQPTGEGVPQGVPGHARELCGHECWLIDPCIEVAMI